MPEASRHPLALESGGLLLDLGVSDVVVLLEAKELGGEGVEHYTQVLCIEAFENFTLQDVVIRDRAYSLRASIRFESSHFVACVKHEMTWYLYDGHPTPKVTRVTIRDAADFKRQPRLHLYTLVAPPLVNN